MQIANYFTDKEKEGIELIQNTFLDKIDKIYVISKKRNVGGGFDSYISIRYHIAFKNDVALTREDYHKIDSLFPVNENNGFLISAYEYNPYDISSKEEVKVWLP